MSALREFQRLHDELYADPERDRDDLTSVAHGQALDWAHQWLDIDHGQGRVGVGEQTFEDITVTEVVLDPTSADSGYPTVQISTCIDLTGFDVLDEDGSSTVPEHRPERAAIDWVVWNLGGPGDDRWVVAETSWISDTPEITPC